jgi:hypothetical protein
MALTDLVSDWVASGGSQRAQAVARLDAFLQRLQAALRKAASGADEETRKKAAVDNIALFDDLPVGDLNDLIASARGAKATQLLGLKDSLAALRHALGTTDPSVAADRVGELRASLSTATKTTALPSTAVKLVFYLITAAAGYFVALYFRTHPGVYFEHQSWLWPEGVLQTTSEDRYEPSADYAAKYLDLFPLYYFNRAPQKFLDLVEKPGDKEFKPSLQGKALFSNPSHGVAYIVSTVTLDAKLSAEPFPWDKINVKPAIALSHERTSISLKDAGVGPAVDVTYKVQSEKFVLFSSAVNTLYTQSKVLDLEQPTRPIVAVHETNGLLNKPLYSLNVSAGARAPVRCPGHSYDIVTNLEQLRALTDVESASKVTTTVQFHSLRNEPFEASESDPAPADALYIKLSDQLVDVDPCTEILIEEKAGLSGVEAIGPLLEALIPEDGAKPKGVDLLIVKTELDLLKAHRVTSNIDQILNPAGTAIVYFNLNNPANGTYAVSIQINDSAVRTFTVHSLAPESYHFDPTHLDDEKRRFGGLPRVVPTP